MPMEDIDHDVALSRVDLHHSCWLLVAGPNQSWEIISSEDRRTSPTALPS
jgi:hypothetical protein